MARVRKLQAYRDHEKKWRWRLIAGNGKIVGDSGQGYSRRDRCIAAGQADHPDAELVIVKPSRG